MKSRYLCPACGKPLLLGRGTTYLLSLHCGNGNCKNRAANEGHEADTEKAAYQKLVAAVDEAGM